MATAIASVMQTVILVIIAFTGPVFLAVCTKANALAMVYTIATAGTVISVSIIRSFIISLDLTRLAIVGLDFMGVVISATQMPVFQLKN